MLVEFFYNDKKQMPSFVDTIEDYPHLKIIRLKGHLDKATMSEMKYFKQKAKNTPKLLDKSVVLDFKNVGRVDTSAIAELLQILKELRQKNYKLGLMNVSNDLREMLKILNLGELFTIFDSEIKAFNEILNWSRHWD